MQARPEPALALGRRSWVRIVTRGEHTPPRPRGTQESLAPTHKLAATNRGRANASVQQMRGLFETEDICQQVFEAFVAKSADELCKPHELAQWVYALCDALCYRKGSVKRKQLLDGATSAAKLFWLRLWIWDPPFPLDDAQPQPQELDPWVRTHVTWIWSSLPPLLKLLSMKCGCREGLSMRMRGALYDRRRYPPVMPFHEDNLAIALQMARHRTLATKDDLMRIWRVVHPTTRKSRCFLRALLLRPEFGFLAYRVLPPELQNDKDLTTETIMAHPVVMGVETVGVRKCAEFVLSVMDKHRYEKGAFVAFNCAAYELRHSNVSFIFEAVKRCGQIYDALPGSMRSDPHIALAYVLCGRQTPESGKVAIEHTMCTTDSLRSSMLYAETLLVNSGTTNVCPSVIYLLFEESVQCNAEFALACFRSLATPSDMTHMLDNVHVTLLADPHFRAALPAFDSGHALVDEHHFHNLVNLRIDGWELCQALKRRAEYMPPVARPLRSIEAKWLLRFVCEHNVQISKELRECIKEAIAEANESPCYPCVKKPGLQPAQTFDDHLAGLVRSRMCVSQVRQKMTADLDWLHGAYIVLPGCSDHRIANYQDHEDDEDDDNPIHHEPETDVYGGN